MNCFFCHELFPGVLIRADETLIEEATLLAVATVLPFVKRAVNVSVVSLVDDMNPTTCFGGVFHVLGPVPVPVPEGTCVRLFFPFDRSSPSCRTAKQGPLLGSMFASNQSISNLGVLD
jgi:hypothetical protein